MNAANEHGNTPLHYACFFRRANAASVRDHADSVARFPRACLFTRRPAQLLVRKGAMVGQKNRYGYVPLDRASEQLQSELNGALVHRPLRSVRWESTAGVSDRRRALCARRCAELAYQCGHRVSRLSFDASVETDLVRHAPVKARTLRRPRMHHRVRIVSSLSGAVRPRQHWRIRMPASRSVTKTCIRRMYWHGDTSLSCLMVTGRARMLRFGSFLSSSCRTVICRPSRRIWRGVGASGLWRAARSHAALEGSRPSRGGRVVLRHCP